MKAFFKNYSYDMLKMFLNQFGTAIFGFSLALSAKYAQSPVLLNATSVGAILFYLFLLYAMTWDIGYRDRVAVESGRKPNAPLTGLWISLAANAVNFLLAIFIMLGSLLETSFTSTLGAIGAFGAMFLEGMYVGLLANPVGGAPLNSYWWVYFLLPIPAMLLSAITYNLGLRDVKFTSAFSSYVNETERERLQNKRRKR